MDDEDKTFMRLRRVTFIELRHLVIRPGSLQLNNDGDLQLTADYHEECMIHGWTVDEFNKELNK